MFHSSNVPVPRSPPISELKSQKPKTRRGKRNSKKSCNNICNSINSDSTWQIYQSNIRGYNLKKESLKYILSAINPNAVILNEVGLRGNKRCSIQGYNTFTRNRKNLNMGGISTAIRKDENQFCLKVDEGENDDEFLITRHCQFLKPINICNVYGEQESRNKNYEIEERWSRICDQLKIIEDRNEEVILIGDMNKLIGNGPFGVKNNKVTFGRKLVHQLLIFLSE